MDFRVVRSLIVWLFCLINSEFAFDRSFSLFLSVLFLRWHGMEHVSGVQMYNLGIGYTMNIYIHE